MEEQENSQEIKWDAELAGRKRSFVLFYCTDNECFMNGRKAYRKAFTKYKAGNVVYVPSDEVCDASASRLLGNVKVKKACKKLLQELQPEVDTDNATRLLHDLALLALYNPADIINDDGQIIRPLSEMGDLAKCIKGIYMTKYGLRVELMDRVQAQRALLDYYNLVREEPERIAAMPVIEVMAKQTIEEWNKINGGQTVDSTT